MAIFSRPRGLRMRAFTARLCALAAVVLAAGCAQLSAPPYAADYEALDRLAQYLEDALMRDLGEISAYDSKSPTRIAARIMVNELDLGVINGTGRMDVEVVVTRANAQRLRKTYRGEIAFDSSYANIVAVPAGQAAYPRLVRALLRQMYADPLFIAAIAP
jgi:hypothetical protein